MLPTIGLLTQNRMVVSVIAGIIVVLVVLILVRTSRGNRTSIRVRASSGGVAVYGDSHSIINTGHIGGHAASNVAGASKNPAAPGGSSSTLDRMIAVAGVVVGLASLIVAIAAWLIPQEPVPRRPPATAAAESLSATAAPAVIGREQARFALVVGNSRYEGGTWAPLSNPGNDAMAISKALRALRFEIVGCGTAGICLDASHAAMDGAIRELRHHLEAHPGAIAFVYYSGHGAQARPGPDGPEEDFLVPVGSGVQEEFELSSGAVPLRKLVDVMNGAAVQAGIIVLDACRNNGLKRADKSSQLRGLGRIEAGGVLLAYAAEPGQVAVDGLPGRTSPLGPYAQRLAEQLAVPGKSITDMFLEVRAQVMADTRGKQRPEAVIHLNRNVYLAGEKAGT